jgi:glycosyltransferase involved in cell wall biosynthesis
MRILHLNTHSYGGAAVVARRLHCAAIASGIESAFITKYGLRKDQTPNYAPLKDARLLYYFREASAQRHWYRAGKQVQRIMTPRSLANRPAGFDVFTPLNTRAQFADCAEQFDPDIIHLHWVAGFVDHEQFFQRNRHRKFVWTLHDMNPFTGGCHHADGCSRFTGDCKGCPQLSGTVDEDYAGEVLTAKMRSLAHLAPHQLTIVAPSQWLLSLSAQSRVTGRFRHVHIENPSFHQGLITETSAQLRAALKLPLDKKVVVFVSDNLRNPRKAVSLLFGAVKEMRRSGEVHLVGLGQRTDQPAGLSITFPGTIRDQQTLARYMACADVVVNTSIAENSPLVLIEALSCGTPVIGFEVGGIPELVTRECGAVVSKRSTGALAAALDQVLFERTFSRDGIRAQSAKHDPSAVCEKYHGVYADLLAS